MSGAARTVGKLYALKKQISNSTYTQTYCIRSCTVMICILWLAQPLSLHSSPGPEGYPPQTHTCNG